MRTMSPAAHRTADRFTARMFRGLWVPAMLSSLGWALSDMADAVVVGQRLGAVGLAAIGLILPVYMINCMFAHGLGLGGSVRYSRLLSQGKTQEAADSFHGVLALALLFSVTTAVLGSVFMDPLLALLGTRSTDGALYAATRDYLQILVAATPLFYLSNVFNYYLRNDGSQRRAGAGSVIGNLCDIALNITLVLALDMGTRGAALSTALGQIITIAIYLPGFFDQKHTLRFALPVRALAHPRPFRAEGRHGHLGAVPVPDDLLPRVQQSADPSGRRNGGGGVRCHSEYLLPDPVPV